jgi:hypothetical protein
MQYIYRNKGNGGLGHERSESGHCTTLSFKYVAEAQMYSPVPPLSFSLSCSYYGVLFDNLRASTQART